MKNHQKSILGTSRSAKVVKATSTWRNLGRLRTSTLDPMAPHDGRMGLGEMELLGIDNGDV